MSSVKRMGEAWGIFPARSQGEQDAYYDDDEQLGYREPSESRLEGALDALIEAFEVDPSSI